MVSTPDPESSTSAQDESPRVHCECVKNSEVLPQTVRYDLLSAEGDIVCSQCKGKGHYARACPTVKTEEVDCLQTH
jgi:hypothetical protein